MKSTLKSLKTIAGAMGQYEYDRGFEAVHRRGEGRGPGVNVQWLAGLLVALAIMAGCVAQQNLSRSAAIERREALKAISTASVPASPTILLFKERLQTGYLDLAMAAYERRAFAIADFFARRSIEAGGAQPPAPIAPDFDAPADAATARREFVALLRKGGASNAPETAALAQLAIDCWLRESELDGALDVRAGCRKQAREALAALGVSERSAGFRVQPAAEASVFETERAGAALAALVQRWKPALDDTRKAAEAIALPVAATLRRRAAAAAEDHRPQEGEAKGIAADRASASTPVSGQVSGRASTTTGSVSTSSIAEATSPPDPSPAAAEERMRRSELALDGFALGGARPTAQALRAIDREIETGDVRSARRVLIEGHADSVGPADYNVALSRLRAQAVGEALADALGAEAPPIEILALGETQLAVATGDGVAEPRNRRVVIRFN